MTGIRIRQIVYSIIFFALTLCILTFSKLSISYAALGLQLWFEKMVPALFPFMIISGILIRLNLTELFSSLIYPPVKAAFQVSKNVSYCMFVGFLCGFPMGAKTVADLYLFRKITREEAEFLLCFVNNIGPVFLIGYALPTLGLKLILPYLAGMYLLPLVYGLFLRKTLFKNKISVQGRTFPEICPPNFIKAAQASTSDQKPSSGDSSLFQAIDDSIQSAVSSILTLGGYMIFFNMLNMIPHILLNHPSTYLSPLFEINGGLSIAGASMPLYILILLPFGGLSCIAQTYSCIKNTDLKLSSYLTHKGILTLLTALFYLAWYLVSPGTFLN